MAEEELFQRMLQGYGYRFLQQAAKSMGLPSSVKKVYLIELIKTRNYGTPRELDLLVRHVRYDQKRRAILRKISKKRSNNSPPLGKRPYRVSGVNPHQPKDNRKPCLMARRPDGSYIRLNAIFQSQLAKNRHDRQKQFDQLNPLNFKANTTSSVMATIVQNSNISSNFSEMNSNSNCRPSNSSFTFGSSNISEMTPGLTNIPSNMLNTPLGPRTHVLESAQNLGVKTSVAEVLPANNYRPTNNLRFSSDSNETTLSNTSKENLSAPNEEYYHKKIRAEQVRSSRRSREIASTIENECRLAKINEVFSQFNCVSSAAKDVMQPLYTQVDNEPEIDKFSNMLNTPLGPRTHILESAQNLGVKTSVAEVLPANNYRPTNNLRFSSDSDETTLSNTSKENLSAPNEEYYHKKIRAEQARSSRRSREIASTIENECRLAKINEVFSQFNCVSSAARDVMQPLYTQVDNEPEIAPNPPYIIPEPRMQDRSNSILEMIYNLKESYQPARHMSTITNTHTIYSTSVLCTTITQPSSSHVHNQHNVYNVASLPRENQPLFMNEVIPIANESIRDFSCHEENSYGASTTIFQRCCSSVESITSQDQEIAATLSIPEMEEDEMEEDEMEEDEMEEDEMEIISNDGDYMPRKEMDIRMRCILCHWAGPKIILEYHIRKEHSAAIIESQSNEFSTFYALGKLLSCRVWISHVLQHEGELYVLSAKYEDPDCFVAALSSVSYNPDESKTGSLTIYNKVTGVHFTWTSEVPNLSPCMPYENDAYCFKLQISKMGLLPNSANLKLLNRELVLRSPNNAVVGQPELDSIHISLVVKILN